ncbi:MAG: hypothetical protein M0042_08850 [Nitrospiraceae bacterium]|nr:hypothetical protein [Nitrospiraceae bacterium]
MKRQGFWGVVVIALMAALIPSGCKGKSVSTKTFQRVGSYSGDFSGIRLSADGQRAYVTGKNKKLVIIDVSSPATPNLLAEENTPVPGAGGSQYGVDLLLAQSETRAIIGVSNAVQVLDISNPSAPAVLSTINDAQCPDFVTALAGVGDISRIYYTACGRLHRVDVTVPAAPQTLSIAALPGIADANTVVTKMAVRPDEQRLFATAGNAVQLFDLSQPSAPLALSGAAQAAALHLDRAVDLAVAADFRTVFSIGCGLLAVQDFTGETAPQLVGAAQFPVNTPYCFSDDNYDGIVLSSDGGTAFVASGSILRVFDMSNPAAPVSRGIGVLAGYAHDLAVSPDGAFAFVATTQGLEILWLQ